MRAQTGFDDCLGNSYHTIEKLVALFKYQILPATRLFVTESGGTSATIVRVVTALLLFVIRQRFSLLLALLLAPQRHLLFRPYFWTVCIPLFDQLIMKTTTPSAPTIAVIMLGAMLHLVLVQDSFAFRLSQQQLYPHTSHSSHRHETCLDMVKMEAVGVNSNYVPPLRRNPPRRICLMVEPTPFTHVSGYANRFIEMLRYLRKAGDDVEILTVDNKTPDKDLPKEKFGYTINHTQGFTFPLYNHISLTLDLPQMKGAQMMERIRPDLIHVTSP